jgi:pilus assembly protein CpaF
VIVRVEGGDQPARTLEIDRAEVVIGKHSACDVVLQDSTVSRRHARIVVEGAALWVEDLGSSNGTSIGGNRLSARTALGKDDEISIGPFRLHAEPRAPRADSTEVGIAIAASAPPAGAGFGPLDALLADDLVSEIMVNGPHEVFVERAGKLEATELRFPSTDALLEVIRSIASNAGRVIDEAQPMLDARLADGSRANAILTPLAVRGPYLTIRRFPKTRLSPEQMVELGSLTRPMLEFLRSAVAGRQSLLVSGGTGSGKTSLLNALCSFAGNEERIVTIEDAAELKLPQRHVLPMETRPPDARGEGQITTRDLVRNALRMRPDRIVVGEVRGGEALDMLQAMNTGHEGSLSTVHANSPREALSRIETLALFAGVDLPPRAVREQIAGAIRLVVQMSRGSDGKRRIVDVSELTGMEGDRFTIGEIFRYEAGAEGVPAHRATGYIPRCREVLQRRGKTVDNAWFAP